jgi:hypothetical protein
VPYGLRLRTPYSNPIPHIVAQILSHERAPLPHLGDWILH